MRVIMDIREHHLSYKEFIIVKLLFNYFLKINH